LCVVERDGRDTATAPDNQGTNRCKNYTYQEQSWQYCFRGEDRLPSLETLLFECGI
jgi:hypothetical protein